VVAYIIRRLITAIFMLFVISAITFLIFFGLPRLSGADPATFAARYTGRSLSQQQSVEIAHRLGFYDPLWVQYGRWAKAVVAGANYNYGNGVEHCPAPCLGYSFITQEPVWPDIVSRLPVTLSLAIGAAIIWVIGGVSIGVLSALKRGTIFDRAAMGVALAGVSLPIFFTGLVLLYIFSYSLGWTAPGGAYTPITQNPARWAYDLLLPWIALAFLYAAGYARLTRAGMLDTMGEDFIRTARAKGVTENRVVVKHGLRAALTPIVTIFGLDLGLLLGGAILTETVFSLQGVGKMAIDAISANDLPKIMGVTILATFFIVISNLVVDVLYAVVDPRVRLG
jgi:peptide/nickel transport system permease protein